MSAVGVSVEVADQDEAGNQDVKTEAVHERAEGDFLTTMEAELCVIQNENLCLFCETKVKASSPPDKENYSSLPGSEGNFHVNQQLWSLFILKNLLKYPEDRIVHLLKTTFGIPLSDCFDLCGKCLKIVKDAMAVHLQLLKLGKDLRNFEKEIAKKIRESLQFSQDGGSAEDGDETIGNCAVVTVRAEIRNHFRPEIKEEDAAVELLISPSEDEARGPKELQEDYDERFNPSANYFVDDDDDYMRDPLYIPPDSPNFHSASVNNKPSNKRSRKQPLVPREIAEKFEDETAGSSIGDSLQPSNHPTTPSRYAYACHICKDVFQTALGRRRHLRTTHKLVSDVEGCLQKSGVYQCPKCPAKFSSRSGYVCHKYMHQRRQERMFQCDLCNFPTSTPAALYKHMAREHDKTTKKVAENEGKFGLESESEERSRKGPRKPNILQSRSSKWLPTPSSPPPAGDILESDMEPQSNSFLENNHEEIEDKVDVQDEVDDDPDFVNENDSSGEESEEDITVNQKSIQVKKKETKRKRQNRKGYHFTCSICLCDRVYTNTDSYRRHMKCHEVSQHPCPTCRFPCPNVKALKNHQSKKLCYRTFTYVPKKGDENVGEDAAGKKTMEIGPGENDQNVDDVDNDADKEDVNWSPPAEAMEEEKSVQVGSSDSEPEPDKEPPKKKKRKLHKLPRAPNKVLKGVKLFCSICLFKRLFTNSASFNRHMNHHKNWKYSCSKCKCPCETESALQTHLKLTQCQPTYEYTCPHCDFVTDKKVKLTRHLDAMHPNRPKKPRIPVEQRSDGSKLIRCTICLSGRVFTNKVAYQRHMHRHKLNKHPCPKCKFPCGSDVELQRHTERNNCDRSNQLSCSQCDFVTVIQTAAKLKKHVMERHPEDTEELEKIEALLEKKKRTLIKTTEEDWLTCPVCSLKILKKQPEKYEYHLKIHQYYENCEVVDGKLKCKVCGELSPGLRYLQAHTRKMHAAELGIPVVQCKECDKTYSRQSFLDDHVKEVHRKQCKFYCDVCGYGTMKPSTLKRHMKWHETEKPFVCELCAATFKLATTLQTHMRRVHASSRPNVEYKCKYCPEERAFGNKSLLSRHLKETHSDMYVHKCDKCGNTYMSVASLQLHQKVNHGGQPAECQFCHVKVINRVYLYTHYQNTCKKKPPGFKFKVPRS